ncbi:MAG: hypothetical protein OXC69_08850 [Candidatus Tectomicrobia bacterium]|nr:hypothetical protein [Candidatus Tectomicrobia bacterium]
MPHADEDDGNPGPRRRAEPGDRANADILQEGVENSVVDVEEPLPDVHDYHGRQYVRRQGGAAQQVAATKFLVQQQGNTDADNNLQKHRRDGIEQPVPERFPVARLGKYPDVVVQPHERRFVDEAFGVEKTQLDGVNDGDEQRSDAQQHTGRQEGDEEFAVAPFQGTGARGCLRSRQRQRSRAAQGDHGVSSSW